MIKDIINLVSRTFISILFIYSGFNKIMNYEETSVWMEKYNISSAFLTPAIFFEILLPIFIIFGYYTKISSLTLSIFCLSTAFIFHADFTQHMQIISFLKNIGLSGGFLFIFLHGAGNLSFDKKLR